MDFNFAEIDFFIKRGYLKESERNKFGITSIHTGDNFCRTYIYKDDNGEIIYNYSGTTNVDPDWGTYDRYRIEKFYKDFEDFKLNKPYKTINT